MPDRRTHIECSATILSLLGYTPGEEISLVETLIDHPSKARGLLRTYYAENCMKPGAPKPESECNKLSWILRGARIPGLAVHDWPREGAWRMLEKILEDSFGWKAVLAARIHRALDCMEQKNLRTIECAMGDEKLANLLDEHCSHVRRKQKPYTYKRGNRGGDHPRGLQGRTTRWSWSSLSPSRASSSSLSRWVRLGSGRSSPSHT